MKKAGYCISVMTAILLILTSPLSADDSAAAQPAAAAKAEVSVVETSICKAIDSHNPVEIGDSFSEDVKKLYCYSKIKSDAKTQIKHIWYLNDTVVGDVDLNIGASSVGPTFSSKQISPYN